MPLRHARRTRDKRWHLVEDCGGVPRIVPIDWGVDRSGHWPRVDFEARAFGQAIECPSCGASWLLRETDCIFGVARRDGNDVLVLVRCPGCRLPHRVRGVGFVTAFPQLFRLMGGWLDWDERSSAFEAEEAALYGRAVER
jgi:hypothetical protein